MNFSDMVRKAGMPLLPAVLNVVLLGLWLGVLAPLAEDYQFRNRSITNANSGLLGQVDEAEYALATMDESRDRFAGLRNRGFLDPQDRLGVTKQLDQMRSNHGLTSIYYEISPERVLEDRKTRKTGFTVVSTKVTVGMKGLFDADLVSFAQAIIDQFPGQVRPISLSLQRIANPTEANLKILREGSLYNFVGGEFVFEWNTLRPIEKKAQS